MIRRCGLVWTAWLLLAAGVRGRDGGDLAVEQCRTNLWVVFDALQAYEKRHKAYPDRLEQLVPTYLKNASYLVCPLAQREGDNSKNRESLARVGTFDPYASYDYELSSQTDNEVLTRLKKSPLDYKLRQRQLVGDVAPMVRCLGHPGKGHKLNLSFDRKVYESGDYWEVGFRHRFPHVQMMPEWVFSGRLPIGARIFPREGQVPGDRLDLSRWYNSHLADGWLSWDVETTNTLAQFLKDFPSGAFTHGRVGFDARGLIQIEGNRFGQPAFPDGVTNIVVNLPVRRIHLLHGTEGEEEQGKVVAFLVVRGPDGGIEPFPIRYGIEVAHWWADRGLAGQRLENAEVAWQGDNPAATQAGKRLRLFASTFELSPGARPVAGLDYLSSGSKSAPFLLAITIE